MSVVDHMVRTPHMSKRVLKSGFRCTLLQVQWMDESGVVHGDLAEFGDEANSLVHSHVRIRARVHAHSFAHTIPLCTEQAR
jgi:hypothetical protein